MIVLRLPCQLERHPGGLSPAGLSRDCPPTKTHRIERREAGALTGEDTWYPRIPEHEVSAVIEGEAMVF